MGKQYDLERSVESYEEEWKRELSFDKFNLDEEFERQPQTYMGWAMLYAHARVERSRRESELDRVKAETDVKIRKDPTVYGLEASPKEAAIKAVVLTSKEVKGAESDFHKAYELQYVFEYVTKAFEQRKELLRAEGELWREGYYSGPTVKAATDRQGRREINSEEKGKEVGERVPRRRTLGSK